MKAVHAVAWVMVLAMVLVAEDPPAGEEETHECPFCHQEISLPNSPEGAFMKVKIGIARENPTLLKESLLGYEPGEPAAGGGAVQRFMNADLIKVEEKDEAAVLVLQVGKGTFDLPAVKVDGRWMIDIRQIRDQQTVQACRANLQQLGTRIYRLLTDTKPAPVSGSELWSLLKKAGILEIRLLNCPRDMKRVSREDYDADNWTNVSYRVTRDELRVDFEANKPVLWEKVAGHAGKRQVLLGSRVVTEMTAEEFDEAMERYEGTSK